MKMKNGISMGKPFNIKHLGQHMSVLMQSLTFPHERDLEQSLSFEFYYRNSRKHRLN